MAKIQKQGVDWFRHDVDLSNDEKIEKLESVFGNDGYAFYIKMLERIYRNGGFLPIDDEDTIMVLAKKCHITSERFSDILKMALRIGLFDQASAQQNGLLTSPGIKKRIDGVIKDRERWNDYNGKRKRKSQSSKRIQKTTELPPSNTELPASNPPLTPEEKSRVENKKENEKRKFFSPPTLQEVKDFFKSEGFKELTAVKAFEYYNDADWHDSSGKKVKNWKQKMRGVWFKDEHRIRSPDKSSLTLSQRATLT